ncbi:MAG: hypothetical protein QNJ41_14410 [Xenococcaceae cyanobacterium MO_188.B32]|nr:hypothetical protein [Xenococcaceae cyanobacterium MO_188.B32]
MSSKDYLSLLQQVAISPENKSTFLPATSQIVDALLEAEKIGKKEKIHYSFHQLLGTWQLRFITGTKKTRAKAGIVLGAGRYLPKFIKICLTYSERLLAKPPQDIQAGTVENLVKLGGLKLALEGPIKFVPQKNILAFDFTRLNVNFFGIKLYHGYIRGGKTKEQEFYRESVGKQAFFAYFLIQDNFIAARGRGGGLALWILSQ